MIDLHCHILPAVDDGPATLDDALRMAERAVADGMTTIVATPHYGTLKADDPAADVAERVAAFQSALETRGIPLTVLGGSELVLTPEAGALHDSGRLVPLNGTRYLLVEIPFTEYPRYTDEALFQLQTRGVQPILAHPERYTAMQANPDLLATLVARGVLAQVTSGSINGIFGSKVKATAETMLRRGIVHIIASDAHVPDGPRVPESATAVQRAAAIVGDARARAMAVDLPAAIVRGDDYDLPPVERMAETGSGWAFWKRWGGRG